MHAITSFICFLVYPLWFPYHYLRAQKRTGLAVALTIIFSLFVLLPIWVVGYASFSLAGWYALQYAGIAKINIPVTGASMMPTIKEAGYVAVRNFPRYPEYPFIQKYFDVRKLEPEIKRGDIVVFRNDKTQQVFAKEHIDPHKKGGFVKRVVGQPGDTLTIKNGFVYVNGEIANEPFTLKPRSTFGANAMHDCDEITIPKDKFLVFGDNRKVSLDSRSIGLINRKDIQYYLPYKDQLSTFSQRWRDTSQDQSYAYSSELDVQKYVRLLNEKRQFYNIKALKYEPKLSKSAELRAKKMLEYDDLSFEATRSGYTMKQAMKDSGYSNIVYGEFPILGYYDAQELIDSFFESPDSTKFLLQKDYDDIGISSFVGTLNGCPVQIVVQHFAGYVPPSYTNKDIEQWKTLVDKLSDIKDGWIDLQKNTDFYNANKTDVDRINEIIRIRSAHARQLVKRMEAKEWFSDEEQGYINLDTQLFNEQNDIADRLNKKLRGT
jgi:signal peptidase I